MVQSQGQLAQITQKQEPQTNTATLTEIAKDSLFWTTFSVSTPTECVDTVYTLADIHNPHFDKTQKEGTITTSSPVF